LLNTRRAIKYSRRGYIEGVKWELGFPILAPENGIWGNGAGILATGTGKKVSNNGYGKDVL